MAKIMQQAKIEGKVVKAIQITAKIMQQSKIEEKVLKAFQNLDLANGAFSLSDIVRYLLSTEKSLSDIPRLTSITLSLRNAVDKGLLKESHNGGYKIVKSGSFWQRLQVKTKKESSVVKRKSVVEKIRQSCVEIKGNMVFERVFEVTANNVVYERVVNVPLPIYKQLKENKHP